MIKSKHSHILSALEIDFSVEIADSQEVLWEAQRLRHQVFCLERGILPGTIGDSLETDHFDSRSRHVVLRRRNNGEVIGATRLVIGCNERPTDCLPMQRYCDPAN